jgi:hypothetical protein
MEGQAADFEAIGNRLGFQLVRDDSRVLRLIWRGPRFPAFLCLGLALVLLFISVPIVEALRLRGFVGAAGSLWYFPLMNLILFGIAVYLLSQKRVIQVDGSTRVFTLNRRSLLRTRRLSLPSADIDKVQLAMDRVYSGFAVAGSSAAESFPVPSLRLVTVNGDSILLDRGNRKKLAELGKRIAERMDVPLVIDPALQAAEKGPSASLRSIAKGKLE